MGVVGFQQRTPSILRLIGVGLVLIGTLVMKTTTTVKKLSIGGRLSAATDIPVCVDTAGGGGGAAAAAAVAAGHVAVGGAMQDSLFTKKAKVVV
jgi:2-methylisocitrate lyase-like PEP mutase family enzyme